MSGKLRLSEEISHADLIEAALHRWEQQVMAELAVAKERDFEAGCAFDMLSDEYGDTLTMSNLFDLPAGLATVTPAAYLHLQPHERGSAAIFEKAFYEPRVELEYHNLEYHGTRGNRQSSEFSVALRKEMVDDLFDPSFKEKMQKAYLRAVQAKIRLHEAEQVVKSKEQKRREMRGEMLARLVEERAPELARIMSLSGAPMITEVP